MDGHYSYITERQDQAIKIVFSVQNDLKSKWHYANDDKYQDKENHVDPPVAPPHLSFAFNSLETFIVNCKHLRCEIFPSKDI